MRKRLFIAINISQDIKKALVQCQDKTFSDGIKWVDSKNFHLTLSFLGDTDINILPLITEKLRIIADQFSSFAIEFERIDLAPPNKPKPTMIWAFFKSNEIYRSLSAIINQEMLKVHTLLRPERKKAIPHITLARFKKMSAAQEIEIMQPGKRVKDIKVTGIDLVESELGANGPSYTVLESFLLSK